MRTITGSYLTLIPSPHAFDERDVATVAEAVGTDPQTVVEIVAAIIELGVGLVLPRMSDDPDQKPWTTFIVGSGGKRIAHLAPADNVRALCGTAPNDASTERADRDTRLCPVCDFHLWKISTTAAAKRSIPKVIALVADVRTPSLTSAASLPQRPQRAVPTSPKPIPTASEDTSSEEKPRPRHLHAVPSPEPIVTAAVVAPIKAEPSPAPEPQPAALSLFGEIPSPPASGHMTTATKSRSKRAK
jgi:hypothetical protein